MRLSPIRTHFATSQLNRATLPATRTVSLADSRPQAGPVSCPTKSHASTRKRVGSSRSLFIDTADDNYIAARWCFVEGLNVDYFWLSVHLLEKYMKAALLLNGHSSKEYLTPNGKPRQYEHDITALYEQVKVFASDLLPNKLNKPDDLVLDHWRDETPDTFIRRFYHDGNAHNRYQLFGFVQHREDLFKLDLMVFALRRLCVPLDAYSVGVPRSGTRRPTHRDILMQQPEWWNLSADCLLERDRARKTWRKPALCPSQREHSLCSARLRSRLDAQQDILPEPSSRPVGPGTAATRTRQHFRRNRRGALRLGA